MSITIRHIFVKYSAANWHIDILAHYLIHYFSWKLLFISFP